MTKPSETPPSVDSFGQTTPDLPDMPDPRRLHDATDRLNKQLLDVEKALAELKLGVSAYVTLEEEDNGWFKLLGLEKAGREFKLVIRTGVENDPESAESTPLTSTSRETRLQAVAALPKLYRRLVKAFQDEIDRVDTGVTQMKQLANAIRTKAIRPKEGK